MKAVTIPWLSLDRGGQAMKRSDRLLGILIALQQKNQTAQELADKFEVSKRTIFRDMQSLSEIGIPLYALAGSKGGYRLMDGFSLPPLQLNTQEALTLLFSLRAMTKLTDTPFNQERWTVLDKITSILPKEQIEHLEQLLESFEMEVPKRNYRTPYLSALLGHTAQGNWLRIFYRSMNHRRWLHIQPIRVYTANGFWYCEAFSETHQENRLFRVDRMEQMERLAPATAALKKERPKGTKRDRSDVQQRIRIKAELTYKGMLLVEQDPDIGEQVSALGEDRWLVDFHCPSSEWDWAVQFFFSLGLEAEVLEPHALRAELYQRAQRVCTRYEVHGGDNDHDEGCR